MSKEPPNKSNEPETEKPQRGSEVIEQPQQPKMSPGRWLTLIALIVGLLGALYLLIQREPTLDSRPDDFKPELVIVQLNDTYRVDAVGNGRLGGLGRVATLVKQIKQQGQQVLIVHAGDFIAPSLESKYFRGQQMVDALNYIHALAPVYVVPGNHEFDDKDQTMVLDAVERSNFQWLASNLNLNVDDRVMSKQIEENAIIPVGKLRLGVFALTLHGDHDNGDQPYAPIGYEEKYVINDQTLDSMSPEFSEETLGKVGQLKGQEFENREKLFKSLAQVTDNDPVLLASIADFASVGYVTIAERQIEQLERRGANVIIGLTHLDMPDDRQVAHLRSRHPNFLWIAGGHEHYSQIEKLRNSTALITKGDSNARSVWKVSIGLKDGAPEIREEKINFAEENFEPDEGYQRDIVAHYRAQLEQRLSYINRVIGNSESIRLPCLYAREEIVRNAKSNWGSYLADQMRKAYANEETQIGILNGGSIRIDDEVCGELRFEHLERTFGFDVKVVYVKIHGEDLKRYILEHAVAGKRGDGRFLQVAGIQFYFDRRRKPGDRIFNVQVREGTKWAKMDSRRVYSVAVPKFLFECNDGYKFREKVTDVISTDRDLRSLVYEAVARAYRTSKPATSDGEEGVFELPDYVRDLPPVTLKWNRDPGYNVCPAKEKR